MAPSKSSVVLIGDSIRMGYQEVVRQELADIADVRAPEQNGGNSAHVMTHLDEWVLSRTPDIVHLNCGLHDIKRESGSDEAAIPIAVYEENLKRIFSTLSGHPGIKIIWATTTPVNEIWHHRNKPFDRFERDVVDYNEVSCRIARSCNIPIHDLYAVMMKAGPDHYLTTDGVHYSDEGSALLGRAVAQCIRRHL